MNSVHSLSGTPGSSFLRSLGLLLLMSLIWVPSQARCQTPSERIFGFLDSASGFYLLGEPHAGVLRPNHALSIAADLLKGADYMIVGYCDQACENLDLSIFGPDGIEVQADRLPDAEPILTLTAEATGKYQIQADMIECRMDACGLSIGILGSTDEPGLIPGEDMEGRLALFSAQLSRIGFSETDQRFRGSLANGQAIRVPMAIEKGTEYRITGVCDQDCYDMDLALLAPFGAEILSDRLDDAVPTLSLIADTTAELSLEIAMVACDLEPCGFRVATFTGHENTYSSTGTLSGNLIFQETHEGELTPEDEQLGVAYLDTFEVEVRAGQRLILDLRSDDFDTLLRVFAPDGSGEESDDYALDVGHSHIETLIVEGGVCSIQVTSYTELTKGAYTLRIAVLE